MPYECVEGYTGIVVAMIPDSNGFPNYKISKYGKPLTYIEDEQQKLVTMKLDDYKKVIGSQLKEEDMIYLVYLVVGDKATQ